MGQYFTNQDLDSNIIKHDTNISGVDLIFNTDNGVFSKAKVDFGTRLLLEVVSPLISKGNILDVGCGYGVIGIYFAKIGFNVDMIDINKRALHLSEMNAKENKVYCNIFESDIYSNVNDKYDYIITNPPIRAGKKVIYSILKDAKDYLKENGALYFVMRKNHGVKSTVLELEKMYNISILKKKNGFYIIEAKKS